MISRTQIKDRLTSQKHMSEALILNLFLAFSGGFQDAYTYVVRDNVFANAQTGNIVLMSTYLLEGSVKKGLMYLFPLCSFMAGIFIADNVDYYLKHAKKLHWRQMILIAEIIILLISGFIPLQLNMLCNCLISFSCALQVQAFKTLHGNAYASTMCIGNIRSGVTAFSSFLRSHNKKDLKKAFDYLIVITVFGIGAGVGGNLSVHYGQHIIWVCPVILVLCFAMMGLEKKSE